MMLLDEIFFMCLWNPFALMYHFRSLFTIDCLSRWSLYWYKWSIKVPCYCIAILPFVLFLLYIFRSSYTECINIYKCYIFLYWPSLSLYNDLFFFYYSFYLKVFWVRYQYHYPSFILVSICMEYLFHPFTFNLCVPLYLK